MPAISAAESGFSHLGRIIPGNDNLKDLLTQIALSEQDRFQSRDRVPRVSIRDVLGPLSHLKKNAGCRCPLRRPRATRF
jgi:hypothetical protein